MTLRIGTWMRETDIPFFNPIFQKNDSIELLDGRTQSVCLEEIDALLLTGGGDISQKFLRQPVSDPSILQSVIESRDEWEFPAIKKALERSIPILAICRGLQVLNVALGGTLHLDIPRHNLPEQKSLECQTLRYDSNASIQFQKVNSSHHQALNQLGAGLKVEAWHEQDDIIEQARLKNYPFALGTQYHPERGSCYAPLFDLFVEEVKRFKN